MKKESNKQAAEIKWNKKGGFTHYETTGKISR